MPRSARSQGLGEGGASGRDGRYLGQAFQPSELGLPYQQA